MRQVLEQMPYPRPGLFAFCLQGKIVSNLEVNFGCLGVLALKGGLGDQLYRTPWRSLGERRRFALSSSSSWQSH